MANTGHVEFADAGRLARRLLNRTVEAARTEDRSLRRLLLDHLGPDAASLPTVTATFPSYDHVNVQAGLDAWLAPAADRDRTHQAVGITGVGMMRHMDVAIADLIQPGGGPTGSAGIGGVTTTTLPAGPGGKTRACVRIGIYLVNDAGTRLAIMVQPVERGPRPE
jgi:hypothetical protein